MKSAIDLAVLVCLGFQNAEATQCAYVPSYSDKNITIIDTATRAVVGAIMVGKSMGGLIAIAPNGKAYVNTSNSDGAPCGVTVVDLASSTPVADIALGCYPFGNELSPSGARLYVPHNGGVLDVIDTATNSVLTTVPVASSNPPRVTVTPNGQFAWVAGADGGNNVTVVDTATNTVVDTIPTGGGTGPNDVVFTPDGMRAYITNNNSLEVIVMNTTTHAVITRIALTGRPQGATINTDGSRVYVANDGMVSVINTATNAVISTIPVNGLVYEVGLTADDAFALAPNFSLSHVSVINTTTNTEVGWVPVGTNPVGIAMGPCPNQAYPFGGFFEPVENLPMLNAANAGRAIPVKFSLGGNQGLDIFETGYPASQRVACDTAAAIDSIEETVSAGGSSLSYNAASDRYTYVWKTDRNWGNSCRQLILKLRDGSLHKAGFVFK